MGVDATEVHGVRVLVLGPLAVEHDGQELHVAGSQRRRLLALLASRAARAVSADVIADALWGEELPPTSTKAIQNHVARLRRSFAVIDGELIATTTSGYRLAVEPEAIDAVAFEQLAADGRRRLEAGDSRGAVAALEQALDLWRGSAYADLGDASFAVGEAARLDELRWAAVEDLAEARVETGSLELAIADLERLVREHPGRERSWGLLIRGLYAAGRQRDAVAAYQRARAVLAEEFGLEPGSELRDLERRILDQDPALIVRRVRALPATLRRHAGVLFGRARERAWLLDGWNAARAGSGQMRLLLGPVDSGRTRLVADVAAAAVSEGGHVVYLRGEEDIASDTPGAFVDAVVDQSRREPVLVAVDDAEWCSARTLTALTALKAAIPEAAVLLLVVADPSASGAAVHAVRRLADDGASSHTLEPLDDQTLASLVVADGVDSEAVSAVVAVASGLPGVARREAAAWAERAATERLTADSASSIGARVAAAEARASVLDDVLGLVAARARRDELASSSWAGRQPYRSLASYDVQDADLFVGRERLVAELASRVLDRRLVAVVGASGSGKSSLVRAGLVPLVRSGRLPGSGPWRTTVLVPGADPVATLDAVEGLDEPGSFLLVLDQFEEVFAAGAAEAVAARLVELSADAALDVRIVIVLRSDHYPALASVRRLAALVEHAHVLVGAPTEEELQRIVEVPARRTGCVVDPALIARVVDDVAGHDAALPLVSAALAEVWERRTHDTLMLHQYVELGGLAAAVERMGTRAIERAGEVPVRSVMLRLVDVTDDGQWVRRRVQVTELGPHLAATVDALVDARIVQRDGRLIDVVHEVVFTAWPQLNRWLEEVRTELVLDRELRRDAHAWHAAGRDADYLYRGLRLAVAEQLVGHQDVDGLVGEFVAASTTRSDRELRSRARRRRWAVGVLVVGLLATTTLAALALRQTSNARKHAAEADVQRLVGQSAALMDTKRDLGLLLAVEANRRRDRVDTRGALQNALVHEPSFLGYLRDGDSYMQAVSFFPDGERMAVGHRDGTIIVLDVETRRRIGSPIEAFDEPIAIVEMAPDGESVYASVEAQERIVRFELPSGRVLQEFVPDQVFAGLALSPDGSRLAVGGYVDPPEQPEVVVWDTATGERVRTLAGDPSPQTAKDNDGTSRSAVAFSSNGLLAVGSEADTITLFDATTFEEVGSFGGVPGVVGFFMEFSPDGSHLATSEPRESGLMLWDVAARRPAWPDRVEVAEAFTNVGPGRSFMLAVTVADDVLLGSRSGDVVTYGKETGRPEGDPVSLQTGSVCELDVSADGGTLAVADCNEPMVALFSLDGHATIAPIIASGEGAGGYSADSRLVWTRSRAGIVIRDARTYERLHRMPDFPFAAFTRDGEAMFVVRDDGRAGAYDYRAGRFVDPPVALDAPPDADLRTGAVDPTTGHIAIGFSDGTVLIVDEQGRPAGPTFDVEVDDFISAVHGLSFSPDGRRLAVAAQNELTVVHDTATGEQVGPTVPRAANARFSPDGSLLVAAAFNGTLAFYDGETLEPSGPPVTGSRSWASSLAFSDDGRQLATVAMDSSARLFDVEAREQIGTAFDAGIDTSAVLRPDGVALALDPPAGQWTGAVVWDLDPQAWREAACLEAGRNLTEAEWEQYIGGPYRATCPGWPAPA